MTEVINIKDAPPGWRDNPRYVFIGRGSTFGNPFRVGEICEKCGKLHKDRGSTIKCFTEYFEDKVAPGTVFAKEVIGLWGKILVCFCKPAPCHGDVIAEWVDRRMDKWLECLH